MTLGAAADWMSENLSEAVRNRSVDGVKWGSPYAAALFPLLERLGWTELGRELLEAFPHYARDIDLVDLRNILVNLGYESSRQRGGLAAVPVDLYPCLFVGNTGEIYVLLERTAEEVIYFDAVLEHTYTRHAFDLDGIGYVFTDTHRTHASGPDRSAQGNWLLNLLGRFKPLAVHLLAMSFFINFIALSVPLFVMVIYDKVIGAQSLNTLPYMLGGIGILMLADLLLRLLRARVLGTVAGRLDFLIGVETFRKLLSLPPLFTERSPVAAQLSRLKQFDTIRDLFTGPSISLLLEIPFVLLFLGVIFLLAGPIGFVPVAMIAIYIMLGVMCIPPLTERVLAAGHARTEKQQVLMQTVDGRGEIKSIGGERLWWERYREISGEAAIANYRSFVANGIMNSVAQTLMTLAGVGILGLGVLAVMEGDLSVGALIATMALTWKVLAPLQGAFLSFSKFQQAVKAMRQINQLMALSEERHRGQAGLLLKEINGRIRVANLSFRYGPDQDPALLGVTFSVRPGEMIALVGDTGSGKSTLLKLIAGMYRAQAGSLMIDKLDIRQINAMDLRQAIAYVPQETKLFRGTITQNLRLNNGLASDAQIHKAAEEAGILDEILALPEGFETRVGDSDTARFPAGFVRAITIARAFVNPARIVLLDEPGASLDFESDVRFMEEIGRLKGKRTVIMVTHRPSHVRLADKAIVLEQGAIRFVGETDRAVALMLEEE